MSLERSTSGGLDGGLKVVVGFLLQCYNLETSVAELQLWCTEVPGRGSYQAHNIYNSVVLTLQVMQSLSSII